MLFRSDEADSLEEEPGASAPEPAPEAEPEPEVAPEPVPELEDPAPVDEPSPVEPPVVDEPASAQDEEPPATPSAWDMDNVPRPHLVR